MKKKLVSKLSLDRETVADLDAGGTRDAHLRQAAGGSARTACGSCPPRSCVGTRCCGPTG
ncbi:MAG: class I lanthipeptide [Acidobacteria bacterium]|nr:class I lanthipeptide [Acidobacteriota bacterium]